MEPRNFKLIITCEHASNKLPAVAKALRIPSNILESHRGYDIGALGIYKKWVKNLHPDFHCCGPYSRLFIDLNRSITNKSSLNKFWKTSITSGTIQGAAKNVAIAYHKKYREPIENFVKGTLQKGTPIIHLAIHSFTPNLNGKERNADIGILYDPRISVEKKLADILIKEIKERAPELRIRKNYPYQGKTDGLCTTLRKLAAKNYPDDETMYAGFEIEFNQKLFG
ncbi:N-formylglutamate amidohydrolase [Fibrobacter sp.]|uniref:N-formylglutamate amidohydrolase n=1 Tax=Fibrobacter sp. TaxID=35828 RepID=UPI0038911A13